MSGIREIVCLAISWTMVSPIRRRRLRIANPRYSVSEHAPACLQSPVTLESPTLHCLFAMASAAVDIGPSSTVGSLRRSSYSTFGSLRRSSTVIARPSDLSDVHLHSTVILCHSHANLSSWFLQGHRGLAQARPLLFRSALFLASRIFLRSANPPTLSRVSDFVFGVWPESIFRGC